MAANQEDDSKYTPHVRWVIPQKLDAMTFVGRDVVAVATDIYITFINFRNNTELVYVANNKKNGDGVDVIAGHKSNLFVFSEKTKNPRIFLVAYPSFAIICELKDLEVNRYKSLCMMECDLIAALTGFPNYIMTVWSWRTQQRLIVVSTGVVRRTQMFMPSRSHLLLCECWGEGLIVWEVAQCYKKCLIMRRAKEEVTGWDLSDPPLVGICWSSEGQLYAIDGNSNLYSVLSDGIGMVTNLEWSEDLSGGHKPAICAFGNGLLIYGPDQNLRSLKKFDTKWKVVWQYECEDEILRLVSNATSDGAAFWTYSGALYRVWGEAEDKIEVKLAVFKPRNIKKIQLIAPNYDYAAMITDKGVMYVYEIQTGKVTSSTCIEGSNISFQASPVDPLLAVFGEVANNYGLVLVKFEPLDEMRKVDKMCLTHQIVSHVAFSPTGREIVAAAMSAGHIFIMKLSEKGKLSLVRYTELGRGLADCFLMRVGDAMRCFSLVLFSDKYSIGERIICINAESGKDNKFAGKMQGPYARLLPLSTKDGMVAIPHLSKHFHVLKLAGDKGVTVSVKMGPIIWAGHDMKFFSAVLNSGALLSAGYDGTVVLREPDGREPFELKVVVTHRYECGIRQAEIDAGNTLLLHLAGNGNVALATLQDEAGGTAPRMTIAATGAAATKLLPKHLLSIINAREKNYLDLQEDKKVQEETLDFKKQLAEVVTNFHSVQSRVVELLEENLLEVPLHQLRLHEFHLHMEQKRDRIKEAEREREDIRLKTEARIAAQDVVTAWIKRYCWDTMLTPRVKLFAIFSHYQVENYPVLPTQRDRWPELQQIEALRSIEAENDEDLFRPWEEKLDDSPRSAQDPTEAPIVSVLSIRSAQMSEMAADVEVEADELPGSPYVLSGSDAYKFVPVPAAMVPQTNAFSFLQMNYLHHLVKLNVQNMRLWFNKQFDELMNIKKREVALVDDRNARLRFIIEELNKLSDLRGSFHHLVVMIMDPQWRQEEQPQKLIKVEPEECSIEPYISPSQVVIPPPEPKPKDDFKERALMDMMDGVLEKLWHEEIKKPVPKPQCMLDKDPEHFNEDDLRLVFEWEAKVAFREEERDKYRKMLHAEYAKLAHTLDEGIANFNQKVKELWLTKLLSDSVIGQEHLNMMRLRRTNLDRLEAAERLEDMRGSIDRLEREVEELSQELAMVTAQADDCQTVYENLAQKDKYMERTFKNFFPDLSPIIVDQCYKFYKKRPKWHQRVTMTPTVLYELASAVLTGQKPAYLHADCVDYFKGIDQLDLISNMPPVMDESQWVVTCKQRRIKIENEIRMRAVVQELAYVESANTGWSASIQARKHKLALLGERVLQHRQEVELLARNKTIQLVLPAGQVEILTTGHFEDYEDATLILREDIDKINNLILKVGAMKLRMMRKQMDFRKGILSKEWEHAQMKMKLRHMEQELYSYKRLKIPKELQLFLKNKELGYTDEQEYVRMEREVEAAKSAVDKVLAAQHTRYQELEMKIAAMEAEVKEVDKLIVSLNVKVSEKKLLEDPLEPIRIRRIFKRRMEVMVQRSNLIREVQGNHTRIVLLQTELELLRLKTYPTLASFRTFS